MVISTILLWYEIRVVIRIVIYIRTVSSDLFYCLIGLKNCVPLNYKATSRFKHGPISILNLATVVASKE
jgi:hypothetical protein